MKKTYLKRWLDYTLIMINCFIFCFVICLDDFTDLLLILVLVGIFYINYKILKKYSRVLKDDEE